MSLTNRQITLIQTTFLQAIEDIDSLASKFYDHLFDIAPETRPLFRGNMQMQGRKLMQTLLVAVNSLNHMEGLRDQLRLLGQRHATYGVTPPQYDQVGEALLKTLKDTLDARFTPEVAEAWEKMYRILASAALTGAEELQA